MAEPLTPEGRLLQAHLSTSGQSAREASKGIGISDTRLRHIINGYQPLGRGQRIEVVAPAATLARIARYLGVTAEDLDNADRSDAADILRAGPAQTTPEPEPTLRDVLDRLDDLARRVADLEAPAKARPRLSAVPGVAAHEEDTSIEDEQGHDENP